MIRTLTATLTLTFTRCGVKLFDSSAKFDSGSGWPAFWRTHDGGITYKKELGGRMEVKCGACGGRLV